MQILQRLLRFRLRTIFLVTAAVACFLAWRLRDLERPAVEAINKAGGKVHFAFQGPMPGWTYFSVAMLPEYIYFSQVAVTRHGAEQAPRPTAMEFLLGNDPDTRVAIVELRLEQMSPPMVAHLKTLANLQFIVVDMPTGITPKDSPEAQRLEALEQEFGGKLCPAFNRGFLGAVGP
jgi:hypothetical protein